MIEKKFGVDFDSEGGALTLPIEYVTTDDCSIVSVYEEYSRTHESGWVITGVICEDYFYWVDEFEAYHPIYGNVKGAFEHTVYADSEEGFQHFYQNHPPDAWDYGDI